MSLFTKEKKKSNQEIVENIILEKYNQYYRLAYSYVHNDADACDIVQNGAYRAIKNSYTLRQPEFAETWVYRIMLNEIFRHIKQPTFLSCEAILEAGDKDADSKEDQYTNIDLQRALDGLSDTDKAIVVLRFFEDKKIEEIVLILDENVNTVKSRLYRSMKKLRITLSDDMHQNTV